uniref:G-protein coupled receptors family 1 profile domain-containing protein n=1 Tax=Romanomermis culicivorax TaxID=13658 RepID=A0A915J645_ROMCU
MRQPVINLKDLRGRIGTYSTGVRNLVSHFANSKKIHLSLMPTKASQMNSSEEMKATERTKTYSYQECSLLTTGIVDTCTIRSNSRLLDRAGRRIFVEPRANNCRTDKNIKTEYTNNAWSWVYEKNYITMTQHNNSSRDPNECYEFYLKYPDFLNLMVNLVIFGSVYALLFVFGTIGNCAMLLVTLNKTSMITVQNVYLMNLAVSDIIVCVLSMPITPVVIIYKQWYFGIAFCHMITWIQGSSIFISTLTLMAIAWDRYVLVVHPHKPALSVWSALWTIAAIWIFSMVVTLPYAYYMKIENNCIKRVKKVSLKDPPPIFTVRKKSTASFQQHVHQLSVIHGILTKRRYERLCGEFCNEAWPSDQMKKSFTTVVFACQFVIPFVIMTYCYVTILIQLKRRIKNRLDQRSMFDDSKRANLIRQKRRSTIILASMVLIFFITWIPRNVIQMMWDYVKGSITDHYVYFVHLSSHCFAMLSIIANPILYAWLNKAFRRIIIAWTVQICCFCRKVDFRRTLDGISDINATTAAAGLFAVLPRRRKCMTKTLPIEKYELPSAKDKKNPSCRERYGDENHSTAVIVKLSPSINNSRRLTIFRKEETDKKVSTTLLIDDSCRRTYDATEYENRTESEVDSKDEMI